MAKRIFILLVVGAFVFMGCAKTDNKSYEISLNLSPPYLENMPLGRVIIFSTDNIFLLNEIRKDIVKFDYNGPAVIGKGGKGPGEFLSLSSYGHDENNIYIFDNQLLRLTIFSRSGALKNILNFDKNLMVVGNMLPYGENKLIMPIIDSNQVSSLLIYDLQKAKIVNRLITNDTTKNVNIADSIYKEVVSIEYLDDKRIIFTPSYKNNLKIYNIEHNKFTKTIQLKTLDKYMPKGKNNFKPILAGSFVFDKYILVNSIVRDHKGIIVLENENYHEIGFIPQKIIIGKSMSGLFIKQNMNLHKIEKLNIINNNTLDSKNTTAELEIWHDNKVDISLLSDFLSERYNYDIDINNLNLVKASKESIILVPEMCNNGRVFNISRHDIRIDDMGIKKMGLSPGISFSHICYDKGIIYFTSKLISKGFGLYKFDGYKTHKTSDKICNSFAIFNNMIVSQNHDTNDIDLYDINGVSIPKSFKCPISDRAEMSEKENKFMKNLKFEATDESLICYNPYANKLYLYNIDLLLTNTFSIPGYPVDVTDKRDIKSKGLSANKYLSADEFIRKVDFNYNKICIKGNMNNSIYVFDKNGKFIKSKQLENIFIHDLKIIDENTLAVMVTDGDDHYIETCEI